MPVVRLREDYMLTIRILSMEDMKTPEALLCVIGEITEGISTSTGQVHVSLEPEKSWNSDV